LANQFLTARGQPTGVTLSRGRTGQSTNVSVLEPRRAERIACWPPRDRKDSARLPAHQDLPVRLFGSTCERRPGGEPVGHPVGFPHGVAARPCLASWLALPHVEAGRAVGHRQEVDVMVVLLFVIGSVAASTPLVAAVLVSFASRDEDSAWTLGGPPSGPLQAAARRIVAFHARGVEWPGPASRSHSARACERNLACPQGRSPMNLSRRGRCERSDDGHPECTLMHDVRGSWPKR